MKRHPKDIFLVLAYKSYPNMPGISHTGLGVSAMTTSKVLTKAGIDNIVIGINKQEEIEAYLKGNEQITHFTLAAPWVKTEFWRHLCHKFHRVQFSVCSHSNVAFLQADTQAVKLIREGIELEQMCSNFHLAANSMRLVHFIEKGYRAPCTWLPNLYYLNHLTNPHRPNWGSHRNHLRIGIFGATRPMKNISSAIAAAIQIASELKVQTEIFINSGRNDDPNSARIRANAQEFCSGRHDIKIHEVGWSDWTKFRSLVSTMHLLLQPSFTETFNMVTADGIAEGVASVVSPAIEWVPESWKCHPDDVDDISRRGVALLHDNNAVKEGFHCLTRYNKKGLHAWLNYLCRNKFGDVLDHDEFEFASI